MNRPQPIPQPPVELLHHHGPVVSVYLSTPSAVPDAAQQLALRWRNVRRQLAGEGAPEGALTAIDKVTTDGHLGGATLVAIADAYGLLYTAHLPEPPSPEIALIAPLPHLTPVLAATQRQYPHIVVVTDRLGAELIVVQPPGPELRAEVLGETEEITKSAPGGWSQRRHQQRAENRWQANAGEVAETLTRLVDAHAPDLVVVSGDVRAVQFLRDQVPVRVADLLVEVQGDYSDLTEALRRTAELLAERAEADLAGVLETYQRARHSGLAVSGARATLEALAAGQVETVLLDPARCAGAQAWFGPEPTELAASAETLVASGVPDPQLGRFEDIVVRAALGTAAAVRVAPPGAEDLAPEGVGALLRYPLPEPAAAPAGSGG